jgi:hypothetical protein
MNFNQLIRTFNTGINWNAYLYVIYKLTATGTTFLLFVTLDSYAFSAWANFNSIIFLALLWTDLGFKKSLPRFLPEFATDQRALKTFTRTIIIFRVTILLVTAPLLILFVQFAGTALKISELHLEYAISIIFIIEGIVSLLRLIFHAHFAQKQFNLIASWLLLMEASLGIICLYLVDSKELIQVLVYNKILCSSLVIIGATSLLPSLYRTQKNTITKSINGKLLMEGFIKHSGVMWFNTSLRSLSERNFLVPLLTATIGHELANSYKIANDGALLFQRMVLKTIGTSDTSLLTYAKVMQSKKKLMEVAFKKLTTKIAALCFPLLGITILLIKEINGHDYNNFGFQLFCIISCTYLIELLLLPYERMLEVERKYTFLISVYVFYFLALAFIIFTYRLSLVGFTSVILYIGIVRLVSMLLMAYKTHHLFTLSFPYREVLIILLRVAVYSFIGWLLIQYIPPIRSLFLFLIRVVMHIK